MLEVDLLDFDERNDDLLAGVALLDFEVEVVGGDPRDALADVESARGLDDQHKILLGVAADDTKKAGEFRFEKAAVAGEFAALERGGGGDGGGDGFCPRGPFSHVAA